MAITYYDPNRPQQRQYEMIMQMLMNMGMQKRMLAARKEEADIANTRMEAREKSHRMWVEAENLRKEKRADVKGAFEGQRKSMDEQLTQRAKQRVTELTVSGRPAVVDYAGRLQFTDRKPDKPSAPVKGAKYYWQRNPDDPTQFIKTRVPVPVTGGAGAGGKGTRQDQYKIPGVMDDVHAHYKNLIEDLDKIFGAKSATGVYNIDYKAPKETPYGMMTYDEAVKIVRANEARDKRITAAGGVPAIFSSRERILKQDEYRINSTIERYRR